MRSFDPDYRRLLEAASFAARRHEGQKRKDGVTPYASHPFRVCLIVRDLFGIDEPSALKAALLHDTIEDTNTDFDDLAERFGTDVATWAAALSKDTRLPEAEREEAYLAVLQASPWQVQVCKLADMCDNVLDMERLDAERRVRALSRIETYYEGLRHSTAPEVRGPLAVTRQVLDLARAHVPKPA